VKIYFDAINGHIPCKVWDRDNLLAGNIVLGPAMIADLGATTIVPPGLTCRVDTHGSLLIDIPN
jgi:N-methylhydantoinase A